jgi:sarcosine oxidase
VFRLAYDNPLYVRMALESLPGWRDLEAEAGETLLSTTGLLSFGSELAELEEAMVAGGATPELLDHQAVVDHYPALSIRGAAVLDTAAGVLAADKVLAALARLAPARGAELRLGVEVFGLEPGEDRVRVRTASGDVDASAVVLCAGPGTAQLGRTAGIECKTYATLEQVAWFRAPSGALPCVTRREEATGVAEVIGIYGLPAGDGVYKFGLHHAGPEVAMGKASLSVDEVMLSRVVEGAAGVITGLDRAPTSFERCVYDNTSDGHFIVDRIGRVVIGASTSGHGFKFGPIFGRLLADLATGHEPGIDLSLFSLARPSL